MHSISTNRHYGSCDYRPVPPDARPSNNLLHQRGGSSGRLPPCKDGYTSEKKYQICPTITPQISSLGTVPWTSRLNVIKTQGRYGAEKTINPKKLKRVSGFLRLQIYTRLDVSAVPRNGSETNGERIKRKVMA